MGIAAPSLTTVLDEGELSASRRSALPPEKEHMEIFLLQKTVFHSTSLLHTELLGFLDFFHHPVL
jgi:hypothetical protein